MSTGLFRIGNTTLKKAARHNGANYSPIKTYGLPKITRIILTAGSVLYQVKLQLTLVQIGVQHLYTQRISHLDHPA